tara:strand:+ start:475 stop:783 length:309 start_codon:yes stop_codon:yes gene_type:complete
MTELEKFDTNGNGKIDPEELQLIELEDRRRKMEDEDAKRDTQRAMSWFALAGLLIYPSSVVFCEFVELYKAAEHLAQMANIYYISVAAIVGSYFGFSNTGKK